MSTAAGQSWKRVVKTFMAKPVPAPRIDAVQNPKTKLKDLKRVLPHNKTLRAPSVLPWIKPKVVIKKTEVQEHKRKIRLQPHVRKWRLPVTILGGQQGLHGDVMPFMWMKLRVKDMKDVENAGGIEAKMISTPASKLSINGKMLRNALFNRLYDIRAKNGLHKELPLHLPKASATGGTGKMEAKTELPSLTVLRRSFEEGITLRQLPRRLKLRKLSQRRSLDVKLVEGPARDATMGGQPKDRASNRKEIRTRTRTTPKRRAPRPLAIAAPPLAIAAP